MAPRAVRVEGGFGSYRWFVYITTLLLRDASWLLILHYGTPEPRLSAIYIVSSVRTSLTRAQFFSSCVVRDSSSTWQRVRSSTSLSWAWSCWTCWRWAWSTLTRNQRSTRPLATSTWSSSPSSRSSASWSWSDCDTSTSNSHGTSLISWSSSCLY